MQMKLDDDKTNEGGATKSVKRETDELSNTQRSHTRIQGG